MERIEEQIQQLRQEIEAHNYAYYVLSSPTISDYDFDQLLKQLERLEQEKILLPQSSEAYQLTSEANDRSLHGIRSSRTGQSPYG